MREEKTALMSSRRPWRGSKHCQTSFQLALTDIARTSLCDLKEYLFPLKDSAADDWTGINLWGEWADEATVFSWRLQTAG